jgi:hypothetical protein
MPERSPWERAIDVVQGWLASQGVDPDEVRFPEPEALSGIIMVWGIQRSGVDVFIQLEVDDIVFLRVYAPLLFSPSDKSPDVLNALLQLNVQSVSACSIGLDEDGDIVALQDRPAAGLQGPVLGDVVGQVVGFAAHYSLVLARRFGAGSPGRG